MSRSWKQKFAVAFRGLCEGVRGGSSFAAHFLVTLAVIAAATALRMSVVEWCILLLCITGVLAAEYFNTALEAMARAITKETNLHVRDALDIASGAVLTAALGSAAVGAVLFGYRLGQLLRWW
jgi:diacylglycerol kinase